MNIEDAEPQTGEKLDSKEGEILDSQITNPLDIKIFWFQIAISVCFGSMMYYLLEAGFPFIKFATETVLTILFSGFWLIVWIYLIMLLAVPFFIFHFKTQDSFFQCLRRTVKSIGTQITLFLVLSTIIYMVNI